MERHRRGVPEGRGAAPRPEASRFPRSPGGADRDGREVRGNPGRGTQQRAWAQRNGALRRERSRARAHAQAQAARKGPRRRAKGPGRNPSEEPGQRHRAPRTGAPGPTAKQARPVLRQPGPTRQSRERRGTGPGPAHKRGPETAAPSLRRRGRATKGRRAPGGRRTTKSSRLAIQNTRAPQGARTTAEGTSTRPPRQARGSEAGHCTAEEPPPGPPGYRSEKAKLRQRPCCAASGFCAVSFT